MFQLLRWWLRGLGVAQSVVFDESPVRKAANESWEQADRDAAVVLDVRPELDACAEKASAMQRIRSRYNTTEKTAELFAPDGDVLARVRAWHGDMILDRVFIKTEDAALREMLAGAIATAHPRVEIKSDVWP